ncbi:hypothetical protein N5D28_12875 [Stutzerimonas stutzeri]|uniref:hypothetical protein n=1 Tax=Stutzerimonas stutzeri TaxID=316 RepID=UPI00244723DB|nr:hypothetical protein [Stutzerimonas stutzeri]MDH0609768.1 hypothetical protein [Stutzerimonas stutzeri]
MKGYMDGIFTGLGSFIGVRAHRYAGNAGFVMRGWIRFCERSGAFDPVFRRSEALSVSVQLWLPLKGKVKNRFA